MTGGVFFIMALIGLVLVVWGVSQMRKGMKDLNRIADELSDIGTESDEDS